MGWSGSFLAALAEQEVVERSRRPSPGEGKSHLAVDLGFALIENGWRVLFARTTDLVQRAHVPDFAFQILVPVVCDVDLRLAQVARVLIHKELGKTFGLSTVQLYLTRWGFSAQKPLTRATQRDPQKIAAWPEQDYPWITAHGPSARKRRSTGVARRVSATRIKSAGVTLRKARRRS